MPKEIERKFLVENDSWKNYAVGKNELKQAYIAKSDDCIIRIRISNDNAWLTLKGKQIGFTRPEFEYQIPVADAEEMLKKFSHDNQILKKRFFLDYKGNEWIVDDFEKDNAGLVVAEIELENENQTFDLPPWVGKDVTMDFKYTNSSLAEYPYNKWKK